MKTLKTPFQEIVLVCNNTRPPGAPKHSCGDHGADALRGQLKKQLKADGLWGERVRVVLTGCLDVCPKDGIVCSFDRGATLELVDAEREADAVLARIRALCE